ncbi:MAG TPA: thiamine pyrophosphate-dependent enzyme [bacterium]|jgi:2-oxoglutarate ferredoxin oxidoreductase subunit beta
MTVQTIFSRPDSLRECSTHYCPGCTHGISHRLVAETLDELNLRERAIGVAPVGCSVLAYKYFNCDFAEAAHGRAPAMATGMKRCKPDNIVFTYQGDGDLASIGMAEIIHSANRGEKITVIFINNAIYGMTGGQMAPTTLPGQVTSTCPFGRDVNQAGYPIRVAELLSTLATPSFIARGRLDNPMGVASAKKLIRQAFQYQVEGRCFSLIELVSTCPTNWGISPQKALDWSRTDMLPFFKTGVFKSPDDDLPAFKSPEFAGVK